MSSSLPNEILEDIFSRLSVKCLLCLKCVCTSWLAIISSPYFVKFHLKRSVQTKTNLSLYVWHHDYYWVDFYSLRDVLEPVKIDYHLLTGLVSGPICWIFDGSCDGLICMSYDIDTVVLCNPSTRKSIILPHTTHFSTLLKIRRCHGFGIGYDNTHDDYKVVRMVVSRDAKEDINDYEIMIYSLRSNLWQRSEKFHHWPNFEGRESIAGGALFYMSGDVVGKSLIVALDLGIEKYRVISNPEYSGPRYIINLDNFEGCLALSCHYQDTHAVDVWLLKEYGGKNEHWSKFISLPPAEPRTDEELRSVKPVAYSKCGKKVLLEMDFDTLVWYNLEEESIEPIMVNFTYFFEVQPCLESLVSLDVTAEIVTIGN